MTDEYFSPDHIFLLNGHGSEPKSKNNLGRIINRQDRRYTLKDNEFYAGSTTCGMLGLSKTIKELTKFITSDVPVEIPSPDMNSFYTEQFPVGPTRQLKLENRELLNTIGSTHDMFEVIAPLRNKAHKIYAPFLNKSPSSSTVPNSRIQLLFVHQMNEPNIKYPEGGFTFEDVRIFLKKGTYTVYELMISGILQSGQDNVKTIAAQRALKAKSEQIVNIFNIKKPNPNCLYIVITNYTLSKMFDDAHLDPLTIYLKEAIIAMFSDSFIKPYEILEDPTFYDIVYGKWPISNLFEIIRDIINDDEPILLINDLCRPTSSDVIESNIAYSNNESDPRSYHPSHPVRQKKNQTRRIRNQERLNRERLIETTKINRLLELYTRNVTNLQAKQLDKLATQRGRKPILNKKRLLNRTKKHIFNEFGTLSRDKMLKYLLELKNKGTWMDLRTGLSNNNIRSYTSRLPGMINSVNYNSNSNNE